MSQGSPHRPRTVAEKVEWLFANLRDENGQLFTTTEIAKRSGLSFSQIRNLREGFSENPKLHNLEALCRAFGVTTKVFLDEDGIAQTAAELELLEVLARTDIQTLALRATDLGPETVRELTRFIEFMHRNSADRPRPAPDGHPEGEEP